MMSTRTGVRALVMVTLCYGALEIVGLLLLLLCTENALVCLCLHVASLLSVFARPTKWWLEKLALIRSRPRNSTSESV